MEHAEEIILHALLTKGKHLFLEQVVATLTCYLLSLRDVPGELRCEALDALRTEDRPKAEACLTAGNRYFYTLSLWRTSAY